MNVHPVTLSGRHVRLVPLEPGHAEAFWAAGQDPEIWQFMVWPVVNSLAEARAWIDRSLAAQREGKALPFATLDAATGKIIGSTGYLDIQPDPRGLEIGRTWLAPEHRRTAANTEAKLLLLRHAFETLGANRVCLKTDGRNLRSQKAIERLGAKKEGVLRRVVHASDGFLRDTVYYSILTEEWPDVKARLEGILEAKRK